MDKKTSIWRALPWQRNVAVLASGDEWVAVSKPEGVRSHPNQDGLDTKALLQAPWDSRTQAYEITLGQHTTLTLCHRLDSPTSGVLLLGLGETAREILQAFRNNLVQKTYKALLWGRVNRQQFVWKSRLAREGRRGQIRVRAGSAGDLAETKGIVLQVGKKHPIISSVKLKPVTGRTHQIRVQAAEHGVPIVGDRTYGNFNANRQLKQLGLPNRLYLHAESIELQTKSVGRISVYDECPPQFKV